MGTATRVQNVERLYRQLYFDDAMEVCRAVLDAGKNSRADMVQLLRYRGLLAAVQGHRSEAVTAFRQLLMVDPLARLDRSQPPRVKHAFRLARAWLKGNKPLMIAVQAPHQTHRRGVVQIHVSVLSDPLSMVKHAVLHIRRAGQASYRTQLAQRPAAGQMEFNVEIHRIRGVAHATSLQFHVAALDAAYNELTLFGSAADPRTIELLGAPAPLPTPDVIHLPPMTQDRRPEPPHAAWYTRWWVWTAVGAVVATSVAVAVGVTASSPQSTVDAPVTLQAGTP